VNLLISEPRTLEEFIECQCGMITPALLELFEPHREFVETYLEEYHKDPQDWSQFIKMLWTYLPEPKNKHFRP
jgi:hypothetical protein